jgi:60 kDa SS-A/Ro ribonucleoprotein
MNYSDILNNIGQTKPILGRTDMIKNNAGGYVFKVSDMEQLERFLLLGTVGGTFYVKQEALTLTNSQVIINLIKADGMTVLNKLVQFNKESRIFKQDTAIFTLALLCTFGNEEVKKAAYSEVRYICKTGTHILTFVSEVNNLRGWSRGLRNAVAAWYVSKPVEKLAYQVLKYANRAGFTHKDVIRLAHVSSKDAAMNSVLAYTVETKKEYNKELLPSLFNIAESAKVASIQETVELIQNHNLSWEMINTAYLNEPSVLQALLPKMGYIALLRNLNRFAAIEERTLVTTIISKLQDETSIKESKVHPFQLLNTLRVYSKGSGDRSSKTWTVNQRVCDALNNAIQIATINNITPTGKSILLAVDVSGSMEAPVAGTTSSAKDVAALMSALTLKTEPNAELIWFDTKLIAPKIGARTSYEDILNATPHGGGTDCSLAFQQMIGSKHKYDAIVIYTDSETWAGPRHALGLYEMCKRINPDLKVIEVAAAANPNTILPNDKNLLRIVGFDASVNSLINNFIKSS